MVATSRPKAMLTIVLTWLKSLWQSLDAGRSILGRRRSAGAGRYTWFFPRLPFSSTSFLFFWPVFHYPDNQGKECRNSCVLPAVLCMGRTPVHHRPSVLDRPQLPCGVGIDDREGPARTALAVAVTGNLLVLALFKYANFVTANLAGFSAPLGLAVAVTNIHLPLGISFFTFHCLSYVIDIYRRRFRANRNPIDIALYISLFPQLVAGPIVRYKTVARQLDARRFTLGRASVGARIFIVGLAQKVLVADVVAPLVQVAFDTVSPSLYGSRHGSG